jgi:hypothetical protein
VAQVPDADATCDLNFDGYASVGTGEFSGNIGGNRFSSLSEMRSTTTETQAVEVTLDIFADVVPFPSSGPFPERPIPDLSIWAGSAAADQGEVLPNVNDDFAGVAPDLGAYEAGQNLPHYGPRTTPAAPTGLRIVK